MSAIANKEEQEIRELINPEDLPTEVELDGRLLHLNTDWRDIKECIRILNLKDTSYPVKARACIEIFIDNYQDVVDGQRAMMLLYCFIDCGDPPQNVKSMQKEMDWDLDFTAIISDMNKVAKCEDIRAEQYMHWFTFVSIYNAIGEGNLTYRVSIRKKIKRHEKLSPDEIEWCNQNPDKLLITGLDTDEDE